MDVSSAENGDERPFFFVHVMKTAGTTFVHQIQQKFGIDHVYPFAFDALRRADVSSYSKVESLLALSPEQRAQIRVYAGHLPFVACELLDVDAITLTILREPVERTVSMLKHCKREMKDYRDLGLDEIYENTRVREWFIDNFQTKQFAFTRADAPGSCLTPLAIDAARLQIAKTNIDSVDVVGTTDHLDVFLEELRVRYGWSFGALENRNVSREKWDVSPALRARIAEDNRFDIAFYEHARERAGAE